MALSWVSFGQIFVISPLHSTSGKFFVKLPKKNAPQKIYPPRWQQPFRHPLGQKG
jgi:hypothetical protein